MKVDALQFLIFNMAVFGIGVMWLEFNRQVIPDSPQAFESPVN